jgi:hypothetical protein
MHRRRLRQGWSHRPTGGLQAWRARLLRMPDAPVGTIRLVGPHQPLDQGAIVRHRPTENPVVELAEALTDTHQLRMSDH